MLSKEEQFASELAVDAYVVDLQNVTLATEWEKVKMELHYLRKEVVRLNEDIDAIRG